MKKEVLTPPNDSEISLTRKSGRSKPATEIGFDEALFSKAKHLAGPNHDMNDQLQMYRSAHELLQEPWCPAVQRPQIEKIAAGAEAKLREFVTRSQICS